MRAACPLQRARKWLTLILSLPVGLPVRKVVSYTLQLQKRRKGDASYILSRVRIKKKKGYLAILYAAYACKCDANARLKKKRCGVTQHAVGQSVSQITVTARSSRMPAAHAAGPGCREPETDCGARR